MNLNDDETRAMATLDVGECLCFAEGMEQPAIVSIREQSELSRHTSSTELSNHMSAFWNENAALKQRYKGCERCHDRNCDGNFGGDDEDLSRTAFDRLFNTMRRNKALVIDAFLAFDLRARGRTRDNTLTYCRFVRLLERAIEKRGERAAWSFELMDDVAAAACDVVWELATQLKVVGRDQTESAIAPPLATFANKIGRYHDSLEAPYHGCRLCQSPCHYRFDMERGRDDWQDRF